MYIFQVCRPPSWIFHCRFLPNWSYNIAIIFIGLLDPENLGNVIGISLLYVYKPKDMRMKFRDRHFGFSTSNFSPFWSNNIATIPIGLLDPKTQAKPSEFRCSSVQQLRYTCLKFTGCHSEIFNCRLYPAISPVVPVEWGNSCWNFVPISSRCRDALERYFHLH